MRHLPPDYALSALRRGKQIEQFLGAFDHGKEHVIRYATLSPGKDHITLYLHEVIDVGSEVFLDVTEFPSLDRDEETWGKIIGSTASPGEALDLAEHEIGAARDRWVNRSVIGDEYLDHRSSLGLPRFGRWG